MRRTKTMRVNVRAKSRDKARWQVFADVDGRSLSDWIREVCNAASKPQQPKKSRTAR